MNLYEYLSEGSICTDLQSTEKNEAIAELGQFLKDHPLMVDYDEFLGAVFAREMESSTGVGDGVAIPHARTDAVKDFVAAVGISKPGVEFDAVDGKPVKVILLMGIPTRKVDAYLRLLAHLSLLMKQKSFRTALLNCADAQSVIETFRQHEE